VDPDLGDVQIGGKPLRRDSPALARKLGLAMAYQDTSLILAQPVKNNLYLAAPPERRPPFWRRKKWARRVLTELDLDLELFPDAPAGSLSLADRQLFEVAKALVNEPLVLLLDEPTTALGPHEVEALHRTLAGCRERGVGVVYVSHRLPEVLEIADRITVLRDGRNQGTFDARAVSEPALVDLIVGRAFEAAFPPPAPATDERREVLEVDGLQGQSFGPVSFTLASGEIVGVAGAEGNGQPQLFDCLAGRQPPRAGRVVCDGKELMLISTREAVRSRIMLLPGDRTHEALMPVLGVRVNATIQSLRRFGALGFLRRRKERKEVEALIARLEIRTPSVEQPVGFLSGGNQQKVAVSRSFLREPSVILAYEPTQGVDVGSRFDIYAALRSRSDAGTALLVKSSDPIELAGLCDRVLVMSRGQIVEEIPGDELDELRIVEAIVRGPGMSRAGRSPLGAAVPKAPSPRGTE
jgi:ribose transport system ATP-binding protein